NIGNLIDVDLGSGAHPLVEFTLDEDTNSVTLDLEIDQLIGVGALGNYAVIIEQFDGEQWVRPEGLGNTVDPGILDLGVLGLLGESASFTLDDLPAGEYRATLVPQPGISLAIGSSRELTVTATDEVVTDETFTVGSEAEGNFIAEAGTGTLDDLEVSSVTFGGETFALVDGAATVEGAFGNLSVSANGTYTYTPNTTSTSGGVD